MKYYLKNNSHKAWRSARTRYYYKKIATYTTPQTYTYNISEAGTYKIALVGGGGGAGQTDGGTDTYSDTGWAVHYGHSGADGAKFKGIATLGIGTLSITIGGGGIAGAGKGNTSGNGGDSYAVFTPTGGSAIEILRVRGGHSAYPDGSSFGVNVSGGTVTYNSTYITEVFTNKNGADGALTWRRKI